MLCRLPWRVANWHKQTGEERVLLLLKALQKFFEGQKFISAGYSLDGKPHNTYANICFLAPIWILFKVRTLARNRKEQSALSGVITEACVSRSSLVVTSYHTKQAQT